MMDSYEDQIIVSMQAAAAVQVLPTLSSNRAMRAMLREISDT